MKMENRLLMNQRELQMKKRRGMKRRTKKEMMKRKINLNYLLA